MADGYARATGKPACVLVTSGPGATNTLTGIMTAHMDSVPMIVVSGQQVTWMLGRDAFQEADIFGVTMPIVKHSYLIKETSEIPRVVREAVHIATSGRPGPVLIDVPKNVSQGPFVGSMEPGLELPGYHVPELTDRESIHDIAEALGNARRPVLLVGHGALIAGAHEAVRALAEKLHAPVTTTLLGKGAFPETHPLSLGMLGMHGTAYANKAVMECDLIMSVGSRFDDRIVGDPSKFCLNATKIHIDIDEGEIGKMIKPDLHCVADARVALEELIKHVGRLETEEWLAKLDGYKQRYPLKYRKQGGLKMQHVIDELYHLTGGRAIVSSDVGQHQMWAAQFYLTDHPDNWLSSGGAGSMGFGFPAAIGAQFGRPDDLVLAIVGDGGFQMTMCELATACIHKLPLKVIVLNNHYLGMVRQWQELFYDERESGVDLEGNPDFAKLAQSFGAMGLNLRRPGDVRKVLTKALEYQDGPVLINAEVEKADNVYPMIPSGQPLETMIIDRPTTKLAKPVGST
jgi:acetolactate synthase-1/2/3 large subunit